MFMSKLRSTQQKNRIWWIVVVLVLGFGLVGSYAVIGGGSSAGVPQTSTTNPNATAQTAQQKIDNFKASLAQVETRLKDAKDEAEKAGLNLAIGNYHYDIAQVYLFEMNKDTEGIAEFKAATDAYKEAIKSDDKNADLRVDLATAAMYSNQFELADEQFVEAIKIDDKHLNANFNYAIFLANAKKDYTKALEQLNKSKEIAKGDKAYLERIDQVIAAVQAEASKPPTTTDATYGNTNQK